MKKASAGGSADASGRQPGSGDGRRKRWDYQQQRFAERALRRVVRFEARSAIGSRPNGKDSAASMSPRKSPMSFSMRSSRRASSPSARRREAARANRAASAASRSTSEPRKAGASPLRDRVHADMAFSIISFGSENTAIRARKAAHDPKSSKFETVFLCVILIDE